MKISILGDIGASEYNLTDFCTGEKNLFSEEIQKICKKSDIVILNLEKPLTDSYTPLGKCPPDYSAPTRTIKGIKLLNPTVAVLANNHIMDQKEQGLFSTIETLQQNEIQFVGAGDNAENAKKPVIIDTSEYRIGIYACCEKEFSGATCSAPGANIFDPMETPDEIQCLKNQCDYVIVLFHGGMQGYPYPTPYQQKVCRKMCDKGADIVVCQHSHIVGCEEQYNDSRIIYGQGNFLLDDANIDSWKTGIIVKIALAKDQCTYDYIPVQTKHHKVEIHEKTEDVLSTFYARSSKITMEGFVLKEFSQLCKEKLPSYLMMLSGKRRIVRRIMRRLGFSKPVFGYDDDTCNMILDYLNCDTHREAIVQALSNREEKRGEYS